MTALPNKLSELLELAVRDAQACEAQPDKFRLRMNHWLRMRGSGVCEVCMAGAVMAQTMGVPLDKAVVDPCGSTQAPLYAIDSMRNGEFEDAMDELGIDFETRFGEPFEKCSRIIRFGFDDNNGRADWVSYLRCVEVLREAGL